MSKLYNSTVFAVYFYCKEEIFLLFYYFCGFFESLVYWTVVSSYLTIVVIMQQVHHISVSALTLDYIIMVFKVKHEVHFRGGGIGDGESVSVRVKGCFLKKGELGKAVLYGKYLRKLHWRLEVVGTGGRSGTDCAMLVSCSRGFCLYSLFWVCVAKKTFCCWNLHWAGLDF